jgi:hypothetical protein
MMWEMRMKVSIACGATIAIAAVAVALAGAAPAAAKDKQLRHEPLAEKTACGGKNSCPSKVKDDQDAAAKTPENVKGADAKGVDVKGGDAK